MASKGCKHHFTVLHKSTKKDESIRKLAIDIVELDEIHSYAKLKKQSLDLGYYQ